MSRVYVARVSGRILVEFRADHTQIAAPHQTVQGAVAYNVTNNSDDLQRPRGSQIRQSTFVDDDSLMKDSRGMRHGGLRAVSMH